jgi:hypothetical protein
MSIIVADNEALYKAASFYAAELGIIDENFVLFIREEELGENMYGLCNNLEDDEYEIKLCTSRSEKDRLVTLGHELVHVRQYLYRELEEADEVNNVRWHGVDCDASYWDAPWEVEAFGLQDKLYNAYYGSTL